MRKQRKSSAVPEFTTGPQAETHDPDSDDEGAKQLQQSQPQRGNITSSDLPRDGDVVITEAKSKKRITLSLSNRESIVCAVCGQSGHTAGFIGAVYVDCPVKPCYLCKKSGHTAATCPFRLDPTLNVAPAVGTQVTNVCANLQEREITSVQPKLRSLPRRPTQWRIRSACLKLHSRRVTALAFPPGSLNLVCSADKKGLIGVWDFEEVTERTVFENVHEYQVNSMRFLPGRDGMSLLTASCDGLICVLDIETGCHHALCNLNPGGWISGVSNERNWNMMQSLAVHPSQPDGGWAGDNQGRLYRLDLRAKDVASTYRIHVAGNKVTSLDAHPFDANLLLTAGNDHLCKLFDVRMLRPLDGSSKSNVCESVLSLAHPRVISAAAFSPRTGHAIMTTCSDNRLRIWDDVSRADGDPSRELVHSHDFNRYLSPFKAAWDPKDPTERTVIIGRYISEDHGGVVLHPIDVIDVGTGALLDSLIDPNLQLINPVNMPHPVLDVVITGSSGNVYAWRPEEAESDDDQIIIPDDSEAPGPSGATGKGAAGQAEPKPGLRGSKAFSVFDIASEEKKAKKKRAAEAKPAKEKATKSKADKNDDGKSKRKKKE